MQWKRIVIAILKVVARMRIPAGPLPPALPPEGMKGVASVMDGNGTNSSGGNASRSASETASVTSGRSYSESWLKSPLLSSLRSDSARSSRKIDYLVVHCSDTSPTQNYTVEMLKADHKRRGFGAWPGYHFYIRRDGHVFYTRPISQMGCHVKGFNARSIGVCYEGGRLASKPKIQYGDTRTQEQKRALQDVLATLREMYPEARIVGHNELNPGKACPCLRQAASVEYAGV